MINLKPTATNIFILLLLAVLIVLCAPLALIWALNTLFPSLAIPYTFETWLAAFIIPATLKSNVTMKGKE